MLLAMSAAAIGIFQPAPCDLKNLPIDFAEKQGVECGWVTVPRRHDSPNGKHIRLWTARLSAQGTNKREDPVLYINGGPGIATVNEIVPYLAEFKSFAMLRQSRDVILFDQRGSGQSEESLCPELAKNLNSIETAGLDPLKEDDLVRAEYLNCRAQLDSLDADLDSYTTSTTVMDMEVLRHAFGVIKWNLVSISYGSLAAMHAMRTHPQSIRSVILNSPYPPNSVTWAEQATSAIAAYAAIDRQCSSQPACRVRFGALMPKLEAALARLEQTPVMDGSTVITGRRFAKALWPLAVRSSTVRFVPLAIDRAYAGDSTTIKQLVATYASGDSFGGYSPAQAIAISCHESGRTAAWYTRARALYPSLVAATPDNGWDRLCSGFRPGFADPAFFAPVSSDIPTLIYAGSLDPATPTVDAFQAMRFLTHATLAEVEGAAHGPMNLDQCTLGIAAAFLSDPTIQPDRACIAERATIQFATDGLDKLLAPPVP